MVKITAWLTDMNQYSGYNDARAAAFTKRLPASATVHSPQLVRPGLLVEVEAVAVLKRPANFRIARSRIEL